jgi:hypothetical protein
MQPVGHKCMDLSAYFCSKIFMLHTVTSVTFLQVFASDDEDYRKDRIFFYTMMIILIGGIAGIAYLFQVSVLTVSSSLSTNSIVRYRRLFPAS